MDLSDWDRANIAEIVGGEGDWFAAHLLRLVHKADSLNRERLRIAFPEVVNAYEKWRSA